MRMNVKNGMFDAAEPFRGFPYDANASDTLNFRVHGKEADELYDVCLEDDENEQMNSHYDIKQRSYGNEQSFWNEYLLSSKSAFYRLPNLNTGFILAAASAITHRVVLVLALLTVCVALYGECAEMALDILANSSCQSCVSESSGMAAPFIATAVLAQSVRNLNATIWNLNTTTLSQIDNLYAAYSGARSANCAAVNAAAQNATSSMAEWANVTVDDILNTTGQLELALNSLAGQLSRAGLIGSGLKNMTVEQVSIPTDYNGQACNYQVNGTIVDVAIANISAKTAEALQSLQNFADLSVPVINTTSIPGCGSEYNDQKVPTKAARTAWIIVICLLILVLLVVKVCFHLRECATAKLCEHLDQKLAPMFSENFRVDLQRTLAQCFHNSSIHLLVVALVCLALGVAFVSILNPLHRSKVSTSAAAADWSKHVVTAYAQFQKSLNDMSYDIISQLVTELDSCYNSFVSNANENFGFDLGTESSIVSKGVALGNMQFDFPSETSQFVSQTLKVSENVDILYHSLKQIKIGFLISGSVLACLWFMFVTYLLGLMAVKQMRLKRV